MQSYFGKSKIDNVILLKKEDFLHIKKVMRYNENDNILVNYENKRYLCKFNKDLESVTILKEEEIVDNLHVHLYVPVLADNKLSFIIEKATELGVDSISIIPLRKCKFSITKDKISKKIDRYNKIALSAAMQSGRINIPKINYISNINSIQKEKYNIICSLDHNNVNKIDTVLKKCKPCDIIQVVFGPEGGFTNDEEELFVKNGFVKTTLGKRVLRTETTPIVVLSIINYLIEKE